MIQMYMQCSGYIFGVPINPQVPSSNTGIFVILNSDIKLFYVYFSLQINYNNFHFLDKMHARIPNLY